MIKKILTILTAVSISGSIFAVDLVTDKEIAESKKKTEIFKLSNGIPVIYRNEKTSDIVHVNVAFDWALKDQKEGTKILPRVLTSLMTRGSRTYPQKKLGVIWIDAHADLHSPYTSPTGNIHGMPLALSLGIDNVECQKNELSSKTIESWNTLKNNANISSKISTNDIVIIGVRDIEKEEDYLIKKHNIKTIKVEEVRTNGVLKSSKMALEHLKNCDIIYISFDVDSMDCDLVSYGTGTPVPNGFSESEVTDLIVELCKSPKLCCFEITEINPLLDEKTNKMVETGLRIL